MSHRFCTFAVAHTQLNGQPFHNSLRTVRVVFPNNLEGTAVSVRFANFHDDRPVWVGNATISLCDETGRLREHSIHALTVHGDTSFALVPGHDVYSDSIKMPVQPGDYLAVSLYYPLADKMLSGNFVGNYAQRSAKGDYCKAPTLPRARGLVDLARSVVPWDVTSAVTTVSHVLVHRAPDAPKPRVVATFGDSIMQQGTWVTPFAARLYQQYPGEISVCNLGIGGNRLLHDSAAGVKGLFGRAGITRYHYDLLGIEGLTHAIFGLGTNDIGLPGKDGAPESEMITLDDYKAGVTQLATDLRARGIKLYCTLLVPREINHVFTAEREALRVAMNEWLSGCGLFDAVLDIGAAIADTNDHVGMKKEYAQVDLLHPNATGGKLMAESIDLSLFA